MKLNSEGFSLPLGSLTLGSRSSSKKECAQASKGVRRAVGVYSSRREHRAMASGGVRGRNTWTSIRRKAQLRNRPHVMTFSWYYFKIRGLSAFDKAYIYTNLRWTFFYVGNVLAAVTVNAVAENDHSRAPERPTRRAAAAAAAGWVCQWVGLIRDGRRDRMSLNCSPSIIVLLRPRGEQEVGDDSDDSSLKIRSNGVHCRRSVRPWVSSTLRFNGDDTRAHLLKISVI